MDNLELFMISQEEKDEEEQASEINRQEKPIIDAKSMKRKEFGEALKRWNVENTTLEVESKTNCLFFNK